MKTDILTIAINKIAEEFEESIKDVEERKKIMKTCIKVFKETREEEGKQTLYVQKSLDEYLRVYEYWDCVFKNQIGNGMTREKAYEEIAQELSIQKGWSISPKSIERHLRERKKKEKKALKREGQIKTDVLF